MIEVRDLSFTYPRATHPTVCGLEFTVEPGEIFGMLGPSGAGKSTTQKILIGLLKNYQGEARVLDRELRETDGSFYERIGVSFELPNHYGRLTALENLSLFASLYSSATRDPLELLEMVGLAEDAKVPVSSFSKGMRMRLNFCRALLNNPDVLFLDEPTSGLDPNNAKRIKEIILSERDRGRTILLTTHDMHVAGELCDRVAFMVEGSIHLIDSPGTLELRYGVRNIRVEYHEAGVLHRERFPLDGAGNDASFLDLLRTKRIDTIHTEEASLEDIFHMVTGRRLS